MKETVLTAGTFDGVHRGHKEVLRCVREEAERRGIAPLAVTFDRHPLLTIDPRRAPAMLTTSSLRNSLISDLGVTPVEMEFDEKLRSLTAAEWIADMASRFNARVIVMGYDHTFGKDGLSLNIDDYRRLAAPHGITIIQAPCVKDVSSSAIRKAIASGEIDKAAGMLGRPHRIEGNVIHGRNLGHTLGFPTANIRTEPGIALPGTGVYVADARLEDGRKFRAVVNIGSRPTVEGPGAPLSIEAHLLDFNEDLYGSSIEIYFLGRIRDEKKFNSLDALSIRIADDCEAARNFRVSEAE